jgi:glycosyltransferase involved in cell wall biosynthesis
MIKDLDGVLALDSFSALIAPLVAKLCERSHCTAVLTNWMPDYYIFMLERKWHPLALFMRWNLISNYSSDSILMMSKTYIDDGKKIFGKCWNGTVFPIPVHAEPFLRVQHTPEKGRIVSVGRLSPMKEYNLHMPYVIANLRNMGFEVNWHVYGDGEFEKDMRTIVENFGLSSHVIFEGVVNYSRLPSVFRSAHFFVGMGTAALEASIVGVPGVYALPFDTDGASCGTICESDIGNFDCSDEMPTDKNITEELVRLLELNESEYISECEKVRNCAMKSEESIVMPRLLSAFEAEPSFGPKFPLYRMLLALYAGLKNIALWLKRFNKNWIEV